MCMPTTCSICGKTTWTGCGDHVAEVRAEVRDEDWCTCPENAPPAT